MCPPINFHVLPLHPSQVTPQQILKLQHTRLRTRAFGDALSYNGAYVYRISLGVLDVALLSLRRLTPRAMADRGATGSQDRPM